MRKHVNRKNDQHQLQGALDEALALWAQDARRAGAHADVATTERAVFARLDADPSGRGYLRQRASFGYAAAAVALLAVGLTGAWLAAPAPRAPQGFDVASDGAPDLEQGSLAVLRLVELEHLAVGR
jgi:hypothetical protein